MGYNHHSPASNISSFCRYFKILKIVNYVVSPVLHSYDFGRFNTELPMSSGEHSSKCPLLQRFTNVFSFPLRSKQWGKQIR